MGAGAGGSVTMSTPYVSAAFIAFALVLAWDYLAPRLQLQRTRREILARSRREAARKQA
jgi:hypothetical protein